MPMDLLSIESTYLIFSPEDTNKDDSQNKIICEKLNSILYAKEYSILTMSSTHNDGYEKSFLATPTINNNNQLRKDAILIMEQFHKDYVIVKYYNDDYITKIMKNGAEKRLSLVRYSDTNENKSYLYNGLSFSFIDEKTYYYPHNKGELKNGMIIEYFNNDKWNQKHINNIDNEYDDMYKLLIKYKKLRFEVK